MKAIFDPHRDLIIIFQMAILRSVLSLLLTLWLTGLCHQDPLSFAVMVLLSKTESLKPPDSLQKIFHRRMQSRQGWQMATFRIVCTARRGEQHI